MDTIHVVIETPKGSDHKYDYDPTFGKMKLNKVMPAGLVFPFDFGFVPETVGGDGDPLDVMVISEVPTFSGCVVECRIIGALKVSQQERNGEKMRNDRLIGVPLVSMIYAKVKELADLPKDLLDELIAFFTSYNEQAGKRFKVLGLASGRQGMAMIEKGRLEMPFSKLVEVFIPLFDQRGKRFPESKLEQVRKTLSDRFSGFSEYPRNPIKGVWKPGDQGNVDELLVFEVMCRELDLEFWKDYKLKLLKSFGQEQLLIRCSEIELI